MSILRDHVQPPATHERYECRPARIEIAPPSSNQSGFTLVEVLVAIALLAVIGAMVFGSLVTTTQAMDAGRERAEREQTVRRVLRVMAEELSLSRYDKTFPWIGMNGTQDGQPADTLAFLAMSDGMGNTAVKESETVRVVYTRERDRLIRFVRRNRYSLTDEALDQVELADRVRGFNVRYYDGQSRIWTDEWRTSEKMPKVLLLEVTFQPPNADPWTIREWISIGAS
ncbi:MAG: prepilin-type N-terminal cleavage/methylation domain-containing protein [Nitrospira sp.]|nr:prepilin-type N-terminal cleavage/methylation domain-containing protein [Nitrospira sp.]MBH0181865.1 prepilin-type N-terminal cleavage/methylation domain-containing protein [Nitrospira sp.]MBH0186345.1 prepilin-type N-terminal cleavage/methylation domain-containing protein [Nitrospira sp.]